MSEEFPYKAWVLMPSFNVKEIELLQAKSAGAIYHITASSKWYCISDLFESKVLAIQEGRRLVEMQKADLRKRNANLLKRIASLDKAEK